MKSKFIVYLFACFFLMGCVGTVDPAVNNPDTTEEKNITPQIDPKIGIENSLDDLYKNENLDKDVKDKIPELKGDIDAYLNLLATTRSEKTLRGDGGN